MRPTPPSAILPVSSSDRRSRSTSSRTLTGLSNGYPNGSRLSASPDPMPKMKPPGLRSFSVSEVRARSAAPRRVASVTEMPNGRSVRVPTFAEVMDAFPGVRINVEAKEPQVARPLVDLIEDRGAQARTLVAAEFERSRVDVCGYRGPWGASRHHILGFSLTHRLPRGGPYTPGADILQVPEKWKGFRIVSPRFIREAQARNLPVHVWTIDDPADMRRLIEWGVDGIQSDRPDLLAQVLTEMVGRPPAQGPGPVAP